MHLPDADAPRNAIFILDFKPTAGCKRQIILRDLEAFGQVRIVIVLAGEHHQRVDLAIQGQPDQDRLPHHPPVDGWHRAWQPGAGRADVGVWLGGLLNCRTAAKHLGLRDQFGVDFEADDQFVIEMRHARACAPCPATSSSIGGRWVCHWVTDWYAWAISNSLASDRFGPSNCIPTGNPSAMPQGMVSAGMPAGLIGTV